MCYQLNKIDQLQAQLHRMTKERNIYQITTIEVDIERRQALYYYEQESNMQLNEILSLRLALEEVQAQLPTNALDHPKQVNIPPITEPIPAQLSEQQEEGLAINIDEFIVEPELPDLYSLENPFSLQVEENPSDNGILLPGYNGALELEIHKNGAWLL